MSENHESKLVNLNEPDKPAIGTVYLIMVLTIVFLIVTFCGLYSFQSLMDKKAEAQIEQGHTALLQGKAGEEKVKALEDKKTAEQEQLKKVDLAIEGLK